MELAPVDYTIIAAYLLAMVGLGAVLARRIHGFKDYFLAGGALTTPILICTLVSTYFGLDVTFGTSESGFYYGLAAWFWYSFPYYIFIFIAALFISQRLRRYEFMTLSDVLGHHYGGGARAVGAIACFVYNMPLLQMAGMTAMFKVLGLPVEWSLAIAVGICAIYTMMGGLWADAISDTLQFLLMSVTLAITIPLALKWVGGFDFIQSLPADHMAVDGGRSWWLLAAWACCGLTVLVEPAFYQRVFAAKDQQSINRALLIGILLWAAYDWGVVVIGMIAAAAVENGLLPDDLEGKHALLAVCGKVLPLGLKGLFLGGVLSAAMSTVDSYSLLASGNLVYDILHPLTGRRMSDKTLLRLTRVGVFVVIAFAAIASLMFNRLRDGWVFMASILAGTVLVPVMAALFARPRRAAGFLGCLFGLGGIIAFYAIVITQGEFDGDEEAYVLRLGNVEVWQDCAALFAIPVSFIGLTLGNIFGRKTT